MTAVLFPCALPGLALLLNAHLGRCCCPSPAAARARRCPGQEGPGRGTEPQPGAQGHRGLRDLPCPGQRRKEPMAGL